MKYIFRSLLAVAFLTCPLWASAQLARSAEFKEKYTLKEVVVLSRHNIRAPLSGNGSALSQLTPHEWTNWSSAPGELSLRGGILETMMGQYFRKWTVNEGLFAENEVPDANEVYVYANSMQRTMATARYFTSGFMPIAHLTINHRMAPSQMDPIFHPRLTKTSDAFEKQAMAELKAMFGKKDLQSITDTLNAAYQVLTKVLDFKQSAAYQTGKIVSFDQKDLQLTFEKNHEPGMKGALKMANSASDALILQYYEEADDRKAAFGHRISKTDWEKIALIKDVYGDILFAVPVVAYNVAHPLLVYIKDELSLEKRKFTFLCGHDSNLASIGAALGVEQYELPHSIEKKTPIGSKMVFEKWVDQDNHEYIAVNMVYQSTQQLRTLQMLDLQHPPMVYALHLKGLEQNADGLYTFSQVEERLGKAISAYEEIK